MATRRSGFDLTTDNEYPDIDEGLGGDLGGGDKIVVKPPQGGTTLGNDRVVGVPGEGESGEYGNTDTGRDLAGPNAMPTSMPTAIAPTSLPQGVSVNENMFSGTPESQNAYDVPQQSQAPMPVAGQTPSPGYAPPESGTGPVRRSRVSPSIFGESNSPTMFGRADGLLGGGKGLVGGSEPSGPLAPTEMMSKLLRLFRQQGQG